MNQGQQTEADLAYVAACVDSRSSLCIKTRGELKLTVGLPVHQIAPFVNVCNALGFRISEVKPLPHIGVVFLDAEVGKVFAQVHPHIRTTRAKEYAKLAFRYWRTVTRRGISLTPEQRAERKQVVAELKKLREPAVA